MPGQFKTYYTPEGIALTDANCIFRSPLGSDTNTGTRTSPVLTETRATALMTSTRFYVLSRGATTENVTHGINQYVQVNRFGDDDSAFINGSVSCNNHFNSQNLKISNLKIASVTASILYINNCIFTGGVYGAPYQLSNCFIPTLRCTSFSGSYNNTILNYYNALTSISAIKSSIFVNIVDLYYSGVTQLVYFQYCLFRKAVIWKFNNVTVTVTYTAATGNTETDSTQWKLDLFNSLTTYYNSLSSGTPKTYLSSILTNWSTVMPVTNKIVDDINGIQIFNKYQDGAPVDYSLKLVTGNPALYMSDIDSFVGKYAPNIFGTLGTILDVDSSGNDTANTPDLLSRGMNDQLYASANSTQYRNRIRTSLVHYPRGFAFNGMQCQINSGVAAHYWWGKMQTYSSTSLPHETIEIIPKNYDGSASSFPRFSAKLNGNTQMWYHTTGAKTGEPVLFNDLLAYFNITTDLNLTEYGTWAVTNADYDSYALSLKAGCNLQNILVKDLVYELNLNYAD